MRKEKWDWFNFQLEDTEKETELKLLVVNVGWTLFICIFCLIILFILNLTCGGT